MTSISDLLLSQLSEFVAAQMGLYFPKERLRDLERGALSAAREFGFGDARSCVEWLVSSPLTRNQVEILASHLTVGETYFFREKRSFEILEEHILPGLISSRRGSEKRLRIWSAGCATGEESYSIAILLSRVIPDLKDWSITILATDINPRFLKKAEEGAYSGWSFRDTTPWLKDGYFKRVEAGCFEILPHIKKMVTFSYLNLAEDIYPSLLNDTNAMDVIFCRNVLMYFSPDRAKKVIGNLGRSLLDGGWLIVSPTEASHVLYPQFESVNFPSAILYRKLRIGEKGNGREWETEKFVNRRIGESENRGLVSHSPLLPLPDSSALPVPASQFAQEAEPETKEPQPTPYAKALELYEQGRYGEASEEVIALLSGDQDDVKAMALLARSYANQGKLAEALEWCEKAIVSDKLDSGLYYLRATILQEQGTIGEATKSLKQALYLDGDFALAHFALGNLALRQGKIEESGKHFENALLLLSAYGQEETLPESEGMTAGRLSEVIQSMSYGREPA